MLTKPKLLSSFQFFRENTQSHFSVLVYFSLLTLTSLRGQGVGWLGDVLLHLLVKCLELEKMKVVERKIQKIFKNPLSEYVAWACIY